MIAAVYFIMESYHIIYNIKSIIKILSLIVEALIFVFLEVV